VAVALTLGRKGRALWSKGLTSSILSYENEPVLLWKTTFVFLKRA
jgi:hypothetical protein